ncbi:MAG: N-acetyltransferase family protein [Halobacteriaceae archaeon]
MVTIRPYTTEDRGEIWELKSAFERELGALGSDDKRQMYAGKLTPEYKQRYLEWVEFCSSKNSECIQLAEVKNDVIGYGFVLPELLTLIWDAAVINEIYVTASHRGTGIADALLEELLATAKNQQLPIQRVVLDVDQSNERARQFYEKHGFEHWGEMVAKDLTDE